LYGPFPWESFILSPEFATPIALTVYLNPSGREARFLRSMQSQSTSRPTILMTFTPPLSAIVSAGSPERISQVVLSKVLPTAMPWMSGSFDSEYTTAGWAQACARPPMSRTMLVNAHAMRESFVLFMSFSPLRNAMLIYRGRGGRAFRNRA